MLTARINARILVGAFKSSSECIIRTIKIKLLKVGTFNLNSSNMRYKVVFDL